MGRMYSGTFLRTGTSASGTIFPKKVTGSQSPACSFKATFSCSSIYSICSDATSIHLKIYLASSDNFVTFVTKKGFWMSRSTSLPTLKSSKRAVKLSISFRMKSTLLGTSLSSYVCIRKLGKWTSSLWRSFLKNSGLFESPDCCYHITRCVVPSPQLNIQLIKV